MANCKVRQQGFEIFKANTAKLDVSVTDCDDNVVNINGATAVWNVARDKDEAAILSKTTGGGGITFPDPLNGKIEIDLEVVDTQDLEGIYYHALTITDTSGNVVTVMEGSMLVKRRTT